MDHCHLAVSVIVVWILHPLVQHWFRNSKTDPHLYSILQLVVTGTAWVVRSEVVLAVAHSTVLVLLSGIGAVPVLSREILLWRAAYLASLGACLWVMRAGARHLLWCILGSQGAKHAALASCGVAGKPC